MGFDGHEIARMAGAMQWLAYAGHESGEHEIFFEIIDATTNQPINGMAYKLVNENGVVAESQKLTNGKTSSFSLKEHPNLTFIAWHDGDVR
ncbi:hypothetical protein [Thauera sinica]|uniref:Uncharacterized protein n=1 Tax=Thauera sinica TaxID=2665146 RepID=A0ABW1AZJ7_9RHOO|nr:hypothetical protein [Thauera sp. K11]